MASQRGRDANQQSQSNSSVTPEGHLTQQGASYSAAGRQRQNRFYVLQTRQDQEGSPDVVTSTL